MDTKNDLMEQIVWREMKSEQGKTFEVGTLPTKTDGTNENVAKLPGFFLSLNDAKWPVGDATWKDFKTGDEVFDTAKIHRYSLHPHKGVYNYCLSFSNNEHYNYTFHDESGDSYGCNTFENGDHWLRYNSDKPAIAGISGK